MSGSKHTRPRHMLAASRVRAPYEPRGTGDRATLHRAARRLKEVGIVLHRNMKHKDESPAPAPAPMPMPMPMPRIVTQRPSAGHYHPASKQDVIQVLRFFGAEYTYGLRRIVLARTPAGPASGRLMFGRLLVPGTVVLYEQPTAPWVLPGSLAEKDRDRLTRAGASIEPVSRGLQTMIRWPGSTLRDFMLFDGLMHEVAHHTLQQYTGKRTVRIARTADHEAYARRFARECRLRYREAKR